jgi:hypothetical protein
MDNEKSGHGIVTVQGKPNCFIQRESGTIDLKTYGTVLGVSLECTEASPNDAKFQYDDGANIPLKSGDPARTFGGFFGSVPVSYNGEIKIKFDAVDALNEVLVIITAIQC